MKTTLIALALVSLAGLAWGQQLQKGALLSIEIMEIELVQGRTIEEFKEFYMKSVVPVYEKSFKGLRIYVLKSARGQFKDELAGIWIFRTEEMRNRYFTDDGQITEDGKAALEKVKDIRAKMNANYGKWVGNELDDWVVQ